jgi:hypothetical protein
MLTVAAQTCIAAMEPKKTKAIKVRFIAPFRPSRLGTVQTSYALGVQWRADSIPKSPLESDGKDSEIDLKPLRDR